MVPEKFGKAILDIRKEEWPLAIRMSAYFFLVITSFWILKPLKKILFIVFYDQTPLSLGPFVWNAAQAEQVAKVLNMVVAMFAVVAFSALSTRLRRQRLSYAITGFFIVAYAAFALVLRAPGATAIWSFYLFGDLFTTLMVATFFAFLNDSLTPDSAKRLFGLVGLGGVLGGFFGSTILRLFIDTLSVSQWLGVTAVLGSRSSSWRQVPGGTLRSPGSRRPVPRTRMLAARRCGAPGSCFDRPIFWRSRPWWAYTRSCRQWSTSSTPVRCSTRSMEMRSGGTSEPSTR